MNKISALICRPFVECFQNDSLVTAQKEKMDEEIKLFKQEKKTFDEERKKFTEAAIKLGQEVRLVSYKSCDNCRLLV